MAPTSLLPFSRNFSWHAAQDSSTRPDRLPQALLVVRPHGDQQALHCPGELDQLPVEVDGLTPYRCLRAGRKVRAALILCEQLGHHRCEVREPIGSSLDRSSIDPRAFQHVVRRLHDPVHHGEVGASRLEHVRRRAVFAEQRAGDDELVLRVLSLDVHARIGGGF
jgi:hypothetical protein